MGILANFQKLSFWKFWELLASQPELINESDYVEGLAFSAKVVRRGLWCKGFVSDDTYSNWTWLSRCFKIASQKSWLLNWISLLIFLHFIFHFLQFTGCSFAGAAIWQYEGLRSKAMERFKRQLGRHTKSIPKAGELRQRVITHSGLLLELWGWFRSRLIVLRVVEVVVSFIVITIKSRIPLRWSRGCRFPGCIVNLGVIPGYTAANGCMASDWHPRTKILTNRETANIGLDGSVGRAPVR